jgi:hypothetical protein
LAWCGGADKLYPRYVEGVRGGVCQQTLPALCGGRGVCVGGGAKNGVWCAWGEVKNNRKGLNALAVVCVLVEACLKLVWLDIGFK